MPINLLNCSDPEKKLYEAVIEEVIAPQGLEFVHSQYVFAEEETGKKRRIDFAVLTEESKIAIELDGYTYHAEGKISPQQFTDQLQRQNELVLSGWKVIRFSWSQLIEKPNQCRDALRRAIIHDAKLHPFYRFEEITPHQIQQEALKRLKESREAGFKKGLIVLATGLGKTYLAAFDIKNFKGRALFIVHNNSILEQAKKAFRRIHPERSLGLFNGSEKKPREDIVFANISSLRSQQNLQVFDPDDFEYVVIDEVHHCATNHYARVMDYFKPAFMLGMTATPNRTDNKSILELLGNNLICQVTQNDAIEKGFLVPFHYFALKDNIDYSNIQHNGFRYDLEDLNKALIIERRDDEIISKYREMAKEGKAIGFCVSIEHANRAAEHFNKNGISAAAIHSKISNETRVRVIEDFRQGKYKIVFVRDVFNEGMDFPDVEVLIFMRPTESKIIFTQQLGRGLRLNQCKKAVMVLDFIGNYINADKIVDYLSPYGSEIKIEDLRTKPVYEYENGCQIHFAAEVVDVIAVLNANIYSEHELINHFLMFYQRLGRCPTITDIQSDPMIKLKAYLERYPALSDFIERIQKIDPALDLTALKGGAAKFKKDDIETLASSLDRDEKGFLEQIKGLAEQLDQCTAAFSKLAQCYEGKGRALKIYKDFHSLAEILRATKEELENIVLILSFRFETPNQAGFAERKLESENFGEQVLENLKNIGSNKSVYIFARAFDKFISEVSTCSTFLKEFAAQSKTSEIAGLALMYALLFKISKPLALLLEDAKTLDGVFAEAVGERNSMICHWCGKVFTPAINNQKICSEECSAAYNKSLPRTVKSRNNLRSKEEKFYCSSCGKESLKISRSQKICEKCLAAYNKSLSKKSRIKNNIRVETGKKCCPSCGKENLVIRQGKKICEKCLAAYNKNLYEKLRSKNNIRDETA